MQPFLTYLYNVFSESETLFCLYFVARFVFGRLERTDASSLKKALAAAVPLVLIQSGLSLVNRDFELLDTIICVIVFVILDTHPKFSDFFTCYLPVNFIVLGVYLIPICLACICYGPDSASLSVDRPGQRWLYVEVLFAVLIAVIFVFARYLHKKYPLYGSIYEKRERHFYILMGYAYLAVMCVQIVLEEVDNNRFWNVLILLFLLMMDLAFVIMLVQEYRVGYFEQTAALNEYYLNSQVQQFENYRIQQTETRRIRHDMSNHLMMLSQLAEGGDLAGIRQYLSGLSDEMKATASELRTGNPIADTIVNAKYEQALRQGISIDISGLLPPELRIAAIDVCTIFANALDNAIEGIPDDCPTAYRAIHIDISGSNAMHMISFRNPTAPKGKSSAATTKDDKVNHGFGLENMKRAAAKYNGQLTHRIEQQGEICCFVLEVVVFC